MGDWNISKLKEQSIQQLNEKVESLEIENEQLTEEVERLTGISSALEEQTSAYRSHCKGLTSQLEAMNERVLIAKVVYHSKDSLKRRSLILKQPQAFVDNTEQDSLQEKYDQLLEQYMYLQERNEELFHCLFSKEEQAALELFIREDAADKLLEATTLSRRIIQSAEEKARIIGLNLKNQLMEIIEGKNELPREVIDEIKKGIRSLEIDQWDH